jgi:superoxide dismutase, Cu-Zn family
MKAVAAIFVLAGLAAGCERAPDAEDTDLPAADTSPAPAAEERQDSITVAMMGSDGRTIGQATLVGITGGGVRVDLTLSGLTPGEHGIHFHETGSCQAPGFESAGGHLNPRGRQHGLENPQGPHAGDMLNLTADPDGNVATSFTAQNVSLDEGDEAFLLRSGGTALVIHADRDDQRTDPSGNSGDRIACGVIARS